MSTEARFNEKKKNRRNKNKRNKLFYPFIDHKIDNGFDYVFREFGDQRREGHVFTADLFSVDRDLRDDEKSFILHRRCLGRRVDLSSDDLLAGRALDGLNSVAAFQRKNLASVRNHLAGAASREVVDLSWLRDVRR